MRILYVSHTHPTQDSILKNVGGMQRVSMQLIDELKRKEGVTVIEETINVSGSGVEVALETIAFLFRQLFALPLIAKEKDADLILFSSMVTASVSYFIRNRVAIPMVTINHGRDVTLPVSMYQWFVPKIFRSLDGVISVSRATRDECIKRGMRRSKGVALPNGFDKEKPGSYPDREESRNELAEEFGLPLEGRYMLLTVGRLVERKGHEWFIRNVLPEVQSDVLYVMIGDGPEQENIERAIAESGYKDRIYALGRQPDQVLNKAYASADLFVMPNVPVEGDMEGFGIVLLEANLAKTPAVASDLEGIKDVIEEGKNGYKVPHHEPEAFAEAVDTVLGEGLEKFSLKSKAYVREKFSWQSVSERYLDFLKEVVIGYQRQKTMN